MRPMHWDNMADVEFKQAYGHKSDAWFRAKTGNDSKTMRDVFVIYCGQGTRIPTPYAHEFLVVFM